MRERKANVLVNITHCLVFIDGLEEHFGRRFDGSIASCSAANGTSNRLFAMDQGRWAFQFSVSAAFQVKSVADVVNHLVKYGSANLRCRRLSSSIVRILISVALIETRRSSV